MLIVVVFRDIRHLSLTRTVIFNYVLYANMYERGQQCEYRAGGGSAFLSAAGRTGAETLTLVTPSTRRSAQGGLSAVSLM